MSDEHKPKHTPGPWHWEDSGLWSKWDFVYLSKGTPEFEANARLIAAAPELLAALRGIIETLGYLEANGGIDAPHRLALIAARAAIAKAEGVTI